MSSLENISSEAIVCLAFADSYTKKSGKFIFIVSEFVMKLKKKGGNRERTFTSIWGPYHKKKQVY